MKPVSPDQIERSFTEALQGVGQQLSGVKAGVEAVDAKLDKHIEITQSNHLELSQKLNALLSHLGAKV